MFYKINLNIDKNLFNEINNSYNFDDVTKGRKGTTILNPIIDKNNNELLTPIIRTTIIYNKPFQIFNTTINDIVNKINNKFNDELNNVNEIKTNLNLNNALLEVYNYKYKKMKFHSDLALDLNDNSYIALYSCYNNVNVDDNNKRKLVIKNKETNEIENKIILDHNSVILFSVETNSKYLHKIVLEHNNKINEEIEWLGLTFRESKTFIKYINNYDKHNENTYKPIFNDNNNELILANEKDKKEFYKLRSEENNNIGKYNYPNINYSISPAELLKPII
jgi:hypothetical protein